MSREVNILGLSFEEAKKAILEGDTIVVPPIRNLPQAKFSVRVEKSRDNNKTEYFIDSSKVDEPGFWDALKNEVEE